MFLLYQLLLFLALLLALPLLPLLALVPRLRSGLGERLGILPKGLRSQALISEGSLWVHAASLGEVNAIAPAVRELAPKVPRLALVFTCTTVAGREQARRLFPQAVACLLLPFDLEPLLWSWVRRFKPRLVLVAETEIWPAFLRSMHHSGARLLLANGRLTERSRRRYRLLGPFLAAVLENFDAYAMQAPEDAERLASLGAKRTRLVVTGNTKFDLAADLEAAREQARSLRRELGWASGDPVVVAGSTRPGEERLLVGAFLDLRRQVPGARLVLAPRHLERAAEAASELEKAGLKAVRRSKFEGAAGAEAVLLDTLGELKAFYAMAEASGLAWVGGSFRDFGGQNPLEAAALGVPVLFGPHMRHFPEAAAALVEAGGAKQTGAAGLAEASLAWLKDPSGRREAGKKAAACVAARAGASKRVADLAWKLLLVSRLQAGNASRGEDGFSLVRDLEPAGPARGQDETRLG